MKCPVITPCDQQQQNAEYEEHDDAIELLKLCQIEQHHLDDRECKESERGPTSCGHATNKSKRRERCSIGGPEHRKRHLSEPTLVVGVCGYFFSERARGEVGLSLD